MCTHVLIVAGKQMTQCSIPLGSPELTVVVHLAKLGTPGGKVFNRFCEGFQRIVFNIISKKFSENFEKFFRCEHLSGVAV